MRAAAGGLGRRASVGGMHEREVQRDLCSDWLADKGESEMAPRPSLGPGSTGVPLKEVVGWQRCRKEERWLAMTSLLDILTPRCPRGRGQAGVGNAGQTTMAAVCSLLMCTDLFEITESEGSLQD